MLYTAVTPLRIHQLIQVLLEGGSNNVRNPNKCYSKILIHTAYHMLILQGGQHDHALGFQQAMVSTQIAIMASIFCTICDYSDTFV